MVLAETVDQMIALRVEVGAKVSDFLSPKHASANVVPPETVYDAARGSEPDYGLRYVFLCHLFQEREGFWVLFLLLVTVP